MKTDGKMTKLKDVAEAAGVSIATASMALNSKFDDSGRVSFETRERIRKIAEELSFHPAAYAKQMKGIKSGIVGLIIPDLMNYFYPEVANGFSDCAYSEGYNVILLNSNNDIDREASFCETLLDMRVDGVAICGINLIDQKNTNKEIKMIKRLQSFGIPVVRLDRYNDNEICPYAGIDNYKAAYEMTTCLIKQGHKHILGINEEQVIYTLKQRSEGYKQAMIDNGLEPEYIITDTIHTNVFRDKLQELLNDIEKYTAIFALAGDYAAIEIIQMANKLGYSVPDDISVAGFDDISVACMINPALTTVRQPKYELGQETMKVLDAMIQKNTLECDNIIIPTQCIQRNSTRIL